MFRKRDGIRAMSVATFPTFEELLRAALPRDTAKRAAPFAKRSYRTVQDWLQRRARPDVDEGLRMIFECEALRLQMIRALQGDGYAELVQGLVDTGTGVPAAPGQAEGSYVARTSGGDQGQVGALDRSYRTVTREALR